MTYHDCDAKGNRMRSMCRCGLCWPRYGEDIQRKGLASLFSMLYASSIERKSESERNRSPSARPIEEDALTTFVLLRWLERASPVHLSH